MPQDAPPALKALADAIAEHLRSDQDDRAAWETWWSPDCVSVESDGTMARSLEEREQKRTAKENDLGDVRSRTIQGPFVGQDSFALLFDLESGQGQTIRELGVFHVKNDRVQREEFLTLPQS